MHNRIKQSCLYLLLCSTIQSIQATDNVFHLSGKHQKEIWIDDFSAKNSTLEFDLLPQNSEAQIGALLRYSGPDQWIYVGCDKATDHFGFAYWYVETPAGKTEIARDIAKLYAHHSRHIKINCIDNTITLYIDGEQVGHRYIPNLPDKNGKNGFRAHDKGNVHLSNVVCRSLEDTPQKASHPKEYHLLESDQMCVRLYKNFPAIADYTWKANQAQLSGQTFLYPYVSINGDLFHPTIQSQKKGDSVAYSLLIKEINVTLHISCHINRNILEYHLVNMEERGNYKVKTLAFPEHHLVSVSHHIPEAQLSIANNVSSDTFLPLKDKEADPTYKPGSILLLNTHQLVATLESNSIYNAKQFLYQTIQTDKGKQTGIWGNEWIYRGHDGKITEQPYIKVILADDRNQDGKTDWQDGAIALQEVYPQPVGVDMLQNSYATITMNFASGAQFPFLRQLDNIKKFYLATDGFGQMLELKGYQGEGHDSAHPDYAGNYNQRAGGLTDFSHLAKEARKYNAHVGVHINHSEAYPEAKAFDDRIVTDMPAWSWLDQSYFINKEADMLAGRFEKRLNQLKTDVPELAFVYLDTYREYRWIAHQTARLFNKNGWAIWTEDADVFDKEAIWIHYNPEAGSLIHRFIHHQYRDGYKKHPALLGGYDRGAKIGFMGWQRGRDFAGVIHNFFTQQLPYRYLMHFPVMQLDSTHAVLANGITASGSNQGETVIRKDNQAIMKGETLFIPWNPITEDKIYHYNSQGGISVWTLPESWQSCTEVYLYPLSSTGKGTVKKLLVQKGQIEINALARTGYVLYKQHANPVALAWSTGSWVKDMGFDSRSFDYWKIGGDTASVSIQTTEYGQDYLSFRGKNKASVQQEIKGLIPGKNYIASAWVCVDGIKEATLEVQTDTNEFRSYAVRESSVFNYTNDTDRFNTRWQRMKVSFCLPAGKNNITLSLKAAASNSDTCRVAFDDIRLVEGKLSQKEGYDYFEDFEQVDEGWGPFIASKPGGKTHLSQRHDVYTENTIHGDWSLATWRERDGEVYRTSPSMLCFRPQQTYEMSFDYKTDTRNVYKVVGYSLSLQREVFSYDLNRTGQCKIHFTTPSCDDFYIAITKAGQGLLVIDDFGIKGNLNNQ